MFETIDLSWIATVDPPQSYFDDYSEAMQLHRVDLSNWARRGDSASLNLTNFLDKWRLAKPSGNVAVFLTARDHDSFPDLDELHTRLPTGVYVLVLARNHKLSPHPNIWVASLPVDDEAEFRFRTGAVLSRLIHLQKPRVGGLNSPKENFDYVVQEFSGTRSFQPSIDDRVQVRVNDDGFRFDFLTMLKSRNKSSTHPRGLLVIGQSAINRNVVSVPHFQRWTWSGDFVGGSVIVLNDPMHFLSDELECGWWFGNRERDIVFDIVGIVQRCVEYLGIDNEDVIFYGGSAGGFSSFHMASILKGSRVVADIPQIDMTTYPVTSAANSAARAAFGVEEIGEVPKEFQYRINVVERFKKMEHLPEFLFLQNIYDTGHYYSQFQYFIDCVFELSRDFSWARKPFRVNTYASRNFRRTSGHVPLNRPFRIRSA